MPSEQRLTQLLIVATIAVLANGTIRGKTTLFDFFELKESKQVLEAAVERIQADINRLAREIEYIESSDDYAQKILRDRYHITGEGESIMFLAD